MMMVHETIVYYRNRWFIFVKGDYIEIGGASQAALIYACEPIWGAVFAYLWRGRMEPVGARLMPMPMVN